MSFHVPTPSPNPPWVTGTQNGRDKKWKSRSCKSLEPHPEGGRKKERKRTLNWMSHQNLKLDQTVIYCCKTNLVAENNRRLWSHSFCETGICGQLSWTLCFRLQSVAGAAIILRLNWRKTPSSLTHSVAHMLLHWRAQLLPGCWSKTISTPCSVGLSNTEAVLGTSYHRLHWPNTKSDRKATVLPTTSFMDGGKRLDRAYLKKGLRKLKLSICTHQVQTVP